MLYVLIAGLLGAAVFVLVGYLGGGKTMAEGALVSDAGIGIHSVQGFKPSGISGLLERDEPRRRDTRSLHGFWNVKRNNDGTDKSVSFTGEQRESGSGLRSGGSGVEDDFDTRLSRLFSDSRQFLDSHTSYLKKIG